MEVEFRNKKGELLKTTMSDDVMDKVADIVENKLRENGMFYIRNGTVFSVENGKINHLLTLQLEATKELIDNGVITDDMIKTEVVNFVK